MTSLVENRPASVRNTTAVVLNKIVFVLLLSVLAVTVIPYGTVDMWWEAVFECLVFGITALWLLEVVLRGSWDIRGLSLLIPLVLISGYAFLQIVHWPVHLGFPTPQSTITIDRYQTYLTARKMLALTLYFGLLWCHISSDGRLRWLVRTVIALGVGSSLFAFTRQLMQSADSQVGFGLPFLFYGLGYGQFIYHNLFAYLMEMTFGLIVGLTIGGGVKKDRILIYAALAVVVWASLILSSSRGGVMGFICESILLVFISLGWYFRRRLAPDISHTSWIGLAQQSKLTRIGVVLVMVAVLAVGVLWVGGEGFSGRLSEGITTEDTMDHLTRTAVWHSTWQLIKTHPLTGVGFGVYSLAITQFQTGAGRFKLEQAHNDYLDLLANGGFIAAVLAIWFMVSVVIKTRNAFRSKDRFRRAAALGAISGVLALLVHSLVDFGLQVTGIATVFAALIVISTADKRVDAALNENRKIIQEVKRSNPRPV